ncbi:putative DNA glycosylase (DNA repair protein) [Acetoanaerobium sticklandii]|uniref:DNA-(apurinic or apyrimidinic site) lyase n=1 Tax=Acetoanaerobium sticklandii (strain ATCC 12662 / DSM 519 / JCM 1433 / CCUG 9281 / NCIMB 10654 / HF) TaxID=499177 RepID=E3PUT3_ACESD|nr:DNA glycosylase [Acetoanaerobium sticklandii]CBH20413.1 putative DNA glycosylase (DNA repair protein) [Acetoanaerobium sticklandii]
MKLYQENNKVIIDKIKDFEPKHIFECGQCFRWDKEEDGSYTGVANGKVLNVKLEGDTLILDNTNLDDYHRIWHNYFDMGRDYSAIKAELAQMDEHLYNATIFGQGMRILNQDTFEIVISFIISARNAIPMIKRSVAFLSKALGEEIGEYRGKKYYAFPTPKALSSCDEQVLIDSKVAFRKGYIRDASYIQHSLQMDMYKLRNLPTDMARKELMTIPGVGPKVSDCILLFGLSKYDVFPVDVWVQRVMHEFYIEKEMKDLKKIREFGIDMFKDKSGIAQQYLFYYAREKGIGRK